MTDPIYLSIITTAVLMVFFYTGRIWGRIDVCNAIEDAMKELEKD